MLAFLIIPGVLAHCPLCTGATIIGVGITRSLGLDDSIVGVFVGGMIISSAIWINNLLTKKSMRGNKTLRAISLTVVTSIATLWTFYYAGLFGLGNQYRIFGIERLIFGSLAGGVISLGALGLSSYLKKKNNGKILFSYQTMSLTLFGLAFTAIILWLTL